MDKGSGRVSGKVALVTGAARGIGRAGAIALAREGADVIGIDIAGPVSPILEVKPASEEDLKITGKLVEEAGARWLAIRLDQRDISALRAATHAIKDAFGGLDIVFANAGVQAFAPILTMEDALWHDQIDVNLSGTANVVRVFAPMLVERGGGRIIVTSSTQGRHGTKFGSAYSASKWGLIGLVKSAAMELGEHGITVNAVIPGLIDTALTRHEERYEQAIRSSGDEPTGDEKKDEKTVRDMKRKSVPLGIAWIKPEDIAPAIVFLASDEARMVSGATIDVTGGDSANYM